MPIVTTDQKIASLYVAFFNRAPDQAGFNSWNQRISSSEASLNDIASGFSSHPVFTSTYGGMDNRQFVEAIYQNTLGGAGDQAGINNWTALLDGGAKRSDMVASFVESSLEVDLGAMLSNGQLTQNDYDAAVIRQNYIQNRTETGLRFVEQLDDKTNVQDSQNPEQDPAYLASIEILKNVDNTQNSYLLAVQKIQEAISTGDPITALAGTNGGIPVIKSYQAERAWSLENVGFSSPESVAWDSNTGKLYVSNVNGNDPDKDGNGFISEVSTDGQLVTLKKFEGLNDPLGLAVHDGTLYAADRDELIAINLETGVKTAYSVPGATRLNDVVADNQGNIYVGDFVESTAAVYKLAAGADQIELIHKDSSMTPQPNGLEIRGDTLYIGSFTPTGQITSYDLNDGSVANVTNIGHHIDGLANDGQGNLLASDYYGQISLYNSSGDVSNVTHLSTRAADIDYLADQNLLLVPTLENQSLVAFNLTPVLL
ncbi:MAG: DUF4214 domain-containing protein [Marinobacterium sp.]|nr:DUF4214 domain-containing protein [Marinobacterium sp.]